jgi:hypothetical protein
VDLVVSSLALHHLNDAKKQYFYKAAADRLSPRALLIADLVDPQQPATRAAAAARWDTLAQQQAEAIDAPDVFQRFVDAQWNHFRFPDAADQPSGLLTALSGLASPRRLRRRRLLVDGCWARRLWRLHAGWSVNTATSGGQLILTGK